MSYSLSLFAGAGWQFFDNNGTILSGGKLYTYSAGTTSPLSTYTSSSGVTSNPNPIILDSAGRVPAEVWVNSSSIAKFVLKDSTDVLIGTWDNIPSLVSSLNLTGTNNGVVYFNSVGTFTSGSNLTFDGTNLGVAGAATVGTNLNVAGASALTGNTTVGGTLNVTGATTLSNGATINNAATFNGSATFYGAITTYSSTLLQGPVTTMGATTLFSGASLTATPVTGDNSTKIATTGFVAATSLGVEQTWQTPVRTAGTVYYNTTGKPILVNITSTTGGGTINIQVDTAASPGVMSITVASAFANTVNYLDGVFCSAIIPPARGYTCNGNIALWTELR